MIRVINPQKRTVTFLPLRAYDQAAPLGCCEHGKPLVIRSGGLAFCDNCAACYVAQPWVTGLVKRTTIKPLCFVPNCADPSCRLDHLEECRWNWPDSQPQPLEACEECECPDIFGCPHNPRICVMPSELAAAEAKVKIKPWTPDALGKVKISPK